MNSNILIMNINSYEKMLLRREWEDSVRLEISKLEEFDRGYYEDNPYCYSWEYDKIPFNEEYYEHLLLNEEENEDTDSDDSYDENEDEYDYEDEYMNKY